MTGKQVKVFLADGTPRGLTTAEITNWRGSIVSARRSERLYPVLVFLRTILHTFSPGSTWGTRLCLFFESNPGVPLRGIGVPDGWFHDPFSTGGRNV